MIDLDADPPRSDSVIESKLSPEQAQAFFDEIEGGLTMKEAVVYLREKHDVTLSAASVSRWCKRRRRWDVADEYREVLNWAHVAVSRCDDLVQASASPAQLLEGNLILASQEFFNASLTSDRRRQRHAARMLTAVTNAARVFRNPSCFNDHRHPALDPNLMARVLASVRGRVSQPGSNDADDKSLRTTD